MASEVVGQQALLDVDEAEGMVLELVEEGTSRCLEKNLSEPMDAALAIENWANDGKSKANEPEQRNKDHLEDHLELGVERDDQDQPGDLVQAWTSMTRNWVQCGSSKQPFLTTGGSSQDRKSDWRGQQRHVVKTLRMVNLPLVIWLSNLVV